MTVKRELMVSRVASARIVLSILSLILAVTGCAVTSTKHASTTQRPSRDASTRSPSEPPAASPPAQGARPNILLLMTDDEALNDMVVMPKTRRLIGATGATFKQAVSSYPLCCPARTTVLTGLQAHNHGVMGNEPPWGGYTFFKDEAQTIAVWLQRAGYSTTLLGKYLNGYPRPGQERYVPPGWTNWFVPVKGTYQYDHFTINENGQFRRYREYQSRYIADRASSLISQLSGSGRPFFLWANFLAPHIGGPVEADDPNAHDPNGLPTPAVESRYRNSLSSRRLPSDPAINEADLRDKDKFMRRLRRVPISQLTEFYQQRLESLRSVDDAVGRILATLRRTHALQNTVVMFVSDNGNAIGQHRWVKKMLGYEDSIRIPFLMRGPGITPGAEVNQQVSLADLSATIVSLARARASHPLDGVSVMPMLTDPSYLADRPMLLEAGGWPFPRQKRLYTGVRTSDGKVLLHWYDGTRELYDLRTDPFELNGRPPATEAELVRRLDHERSRLATCRGQGCNSTTSP